MTAAAQTPRTDLLERTTLNPADLLALCRELERLAREVDDVGPVPRRAYGNDPFPGESPSAPGGE